MSGLSTSGQWAVFGSLSVLLVLGFILWLKFLPRLRLYKQRKLRLGSINKRYVELCRARKDIVYHFFWAVDRGDNKEADIHEERVLDIDRKLGDLRGQFKLVEVDAPVR